MDKATIHIHRNNHSPVFWRHILRGRFLQKRGNRRELADDTVGAVRGAIANLNSAAGHQRDFPTRTPGDAQLKQGHGKKSANLPKPPGPCPLPCIPIDHVIALLASLPEIRAKILFFIDNYLWFWLCWYA